MSLIEANGNGGTKINAGGATVEFNKTKPKIVKAGIGISGLVTFAIIAGGWVFGFGEKSAKQEVMQNDLTKQELRLERVEEDITEIKETQAEVKTDVKWIREKLSEK